MRVAAARRHDSIAAFAAALDAGYLQIFTGSQPASADAELGEANTVLAELGFAATAFGSVSGSVLTANAIEPAAAVASGLATFARCFTEDGTAIADVTAGTEGAELTLTAATIEDDDPVAPTALVVVFPATPPAERTMLVASESRAMAVPSEQRRMAVQ